jgi:hypothetical protein
LSNLILLDTKFQAGSFILTPITPHPRVSIIKTVSQAVGLERSRSSTKVSDREHHADPEHSASECSCGNRIVLSAGIQLADNVPSSAGNLRRSLFSAEHFLTLVSQCRRLQ